MKSTPAGHRPLTYPPFKVHASEHVRSGCLPTSPNGACLITLLFQRSTSLSAPTGELAGARPHRHHPHAAAPPAIKVLSLPPRPSPPMIDVLRTTRGTEPKLPLTTPWLGHRRHAAQGDRATRRLSSAQRRRSPHSGSWSSYASRTLCVMSIVDPPRNATYIRLQLTNDHVHHDAHGTPKDLAIPIDMWEPFYRKAEAIGLLVKMSPTSENEPIWREMDTCVKAALRDASLLLQWAPSTALDTFGNLDWTLVRPSFKAATHSHVMKRDRKLQAMDFTVPKLVQSSSFKNPKEGEAGQDIIIIGANTLFFFIAALRTEIP